MLLFNLNEFLNDISNHINNILDSYGNNHIFWIIIAILILVIGYWAIRYLNKNK